MPSTSPGDAPTIPSSFEQILPGAPITSLQSLATFIFRQKQYIAYISGHQLNLLSSPKTLVQAVTFDSELVALCAETRTGKLCVASKKDTWVLEPQTQGWTRVWWSKTLSLLTEDEGDEACSLTWGNAGEVLVGRGVQLSLFNTLPSSSTSSPDDVASKDVKIEERRPLWSKSVSSPTQYARFSPNGEIIATSGQYDRLVKIWRRLSYEEGLFDYTYLPHPGAVTHLEWRPSDHNPGDHLESGASGRHDDEPEVLYTLAADGLLRVWATGSPHDLDIMVLHTTVDLTSAIPQSPSLTAKRPSTSAPTTQPARYAFIVPADQFTQAVDALLPLGNEKLSHTLEHLKETSSQSPDVIVALDGAGRMSAWGLQPIGHKRRPETPSGYSKQVFHISHAERLPLKLPEGEDARIVSWFEDGRFNLLVHGFGGYVQWWRGRMEEFFPPSAAGEGVLEEVGWWGGHQTGSIERLCGSGEGGEVLSCSARRELALWRGGKEGVVHCAAVYSSENEVLDTVLCSNGRAIVLEQIKEDARKVQISIRDEAGRVLETKARELEIGDDSATWKLYSSAQQSSDLRLVALSSNGRGFTCQIIRKDSTSVTLSDLTAISLPMPDDNQVLAHTSAILDSTQPDRIGFVGVTKSGSLLLYHFELPDSESTGPMLMATYETGIQDPSLLACNNEFAAVVSSDGNSFAIINLRDGYIEQRQALGRQIKNIVPAPKHNLVAVGYDTYVNILAQGRYEHFEEMPPWILIKQVSLADIGLTISAVTWTGDGGFAIAAGNGIFFSSNDVPVKELHHDVQEAIDADPKSEEAHQLSSLAHKLKKPLPVWHPSLVAHTVRHGHWSLASNILSKLTEKLKFWSEGDELHPHLEMPTEQLYETNSVSTVSALDEDTMADLTQLLDEKNLPEVSQSEQERLKRVLQAMTYCSAHVNGLDNGALRFLFSWRLQLLHLEATQTNGTQPNGLHTSDTAVPEMHWREIAFAYHSTTQQPLLDLLLAHYDNKITWPIARHLGLFAWLSDREALDRIFDSLAQSAYRSTNPADPINASLYFLALHKKATLLTLWRIATWHKEQKATMSFLKRDFGLKENQTAAKKNAYALMGKKRFDYAAAFFLLAEDPASATSLLASQCEDVMLAIAVARLYSGDGSDVLRSLLEGRLMPLARQKGDRWLMSWFHAILFEKEAAAEALVQPLEGVRTWQQDDPNTLTLYRNLRKMPSEYEYEAVLRAARILRRMGLWLLALELVSQWEFKPSQPSTTGFAEPKPVVNGIYDAPPSTLDDFTQHVQPKEPPSMLDDFTSPPAPLADDKAAREAKAAELLKKLKAKKEESVPVINEKKPEPTQFKEPDANSLLDSFGF